jgi:tetratricopeptide (TPR) repeat protein
VELEAEPEPVPPPAEVQPVPVEAAPAEEAVAYEFTPEEVAELAPQPDAAEPAPAEAEPGAIEVEPVPLEAAAEPPASVVFEELSAEVTEAVASEGEYEIETAEPVAEMAAAAEEPAAMTSDQFLSELGAELDDFKIAEPSAAAPSAKTSAKAGAPARGRKQMDQLKEVFDEFKADMGEVEEVEDIETHYNLGIAYKEMGLLDEAISEFQKASKAAEKQRAHANLFQCCILLGHCFMEKGHPQIAARWYERALKTPGVDEEGATALRYDMGVALEQAGDRKGALNCFLEVYGANVDYRDVGDRIRELQGA